MIKLAKAFYRGFIGGPSFDNCIHHRLILEEKLLTLDVPDSNVSAVPSTIDVSFPYNSTSWFNQHKKNYLHHEAASSAGASAVSSFANSRLSF